MARCADTSPRRQHSLIASVWAMARVAELAVYIHSESGKHIRPHDTRSRAMYVLPWRGGMQMARFRAPPGKVPVTHCVTD